MCGEPMSTKDAAKREAQYRVESDHRSLTEAETIRTDRKRFGAARGYARKQIVMNRRIVGGKR